MFDDFNQRHKEMNDQFDIQFKRVGRLAVFGTIFGAVVILAVLGLAAYLVFKLV